MKLELLSEATPKELMNAIGLRYFKKLQDPMRTDKAQKRFQPARSGNQDTPLKPRHRFYFNAPIGATQGKIGYGISLGGEVAGGDAGPERKGPRRIGHFQRKGKAGLV
jgi:hypothetical protein